MITQRIYRSKAVGEAGYRMYIVVVRVGVSIVSAAIDPGNDEVCTCDYNRRKMMIERENDDMLQKACKYI